MLEDELDDFIRVLKGQQKDNYCFYVGRDYREDALIIEHYRGHDVVFHPLLDDDAVIFAPKQNWN